MPSSTLRMCHKIQPHPNLMHAYSLQWKKKHGIKGSDGALPLESIANNIAHRPNTRARCSSLFTRLFIANIESVISLKRIYVPEHLVHRMVVCTSHNLCHNEVRRQERTHSKPHGQDRVGGKEAIERHTLAVMMLLLQRSCHLLLCRNEYELLFLPTCYVILLTTVSNDQLTSVSRCILTGTEQSRNNRMHVASFIMCYIGINY
jgi:hypothetical protein